MSGVSFDRLTNLRTLDLAHNSLVSVPRQIGYPTLTSHIESCSLVTSEMFISWLLDSLTSFTFLTQLRKLWLNNNSLRTVPGEFHFFPPSIDILLNSNPLDVCWQTLLQATSTNLILLYQYPFSQLVSEGVPTLLDKIAPFIKGNHGFYILILFPLISQNIAYGPKCIVIEDISTVPAGKPLSAKLVVRRYWHWFIIVMIVTTDTWYRQQTM